MDLDGKTALITGSSRNIGRAIAERMARAGADVGITARSDREGCKETMSVVEATGSDAAYAVGDLGDTDAVDRVVDDIRSELGPIDVLVNNAAVRPRKPFLDVTSEECDRVNAVNLRGTYRMTQRVIPDMIDDGDGSVINVLGLFVSMGAAGFSHSFASKAGVAGLVRQLASELGPEGIRVNGVAPGSIDTIEDGSHEDETIEQQIVKATPLQRQGEPEEIADACCFLGSDSASFITGQILHVNGGLYPTPNIIDA